jgi:hypothetical protein
MWPERFQSLTERVGRMQMNYGHAMAEPNSFRSGYPVPTVIFREGLEVETFARMLYFSVREGRLRLRFQLDSSKGGAEQAFEAAFMGEKAGRPLFSAPATLSVSNEYRVDAEIAGEFAQNWEPLKVTDPMPFRMILRAPVGGG